MRRPCRARRPILKETISPREGELSHHGNRLKLRGVSRIMQASRRELLTPHGPRTCFGGSDLFGSRFVPLGRPGFIFRLNLQNKRSRLNSQTAKSSEQAENLQDNSGKVEHQSIHRGHPLPLSRIGNGCKEGAILPPNKAVLQV